MYIVFYSYGELCDMIYFWYIVLSEYIFWNIFWRNDFNLQNDCRFREVDFLFVVWEFVCSWVGLGVVLRVFKVLRKKFKSYR